MAKVTRAGRKKLDELEKELAEDIQRYWKGNLLNSQQSLAGDIKIFEDEEGTVIGSTNPILKYLEWGTEPHVITPDEAEALRWFNDAGDAVFAKRVQHPGTKPYGHLRSAIDRVRFQ